MADLLHAIVGATRRIVEERAQRQPYHVIERLARDRTPNGAAFVARLCDAGRVNVIAECKRRSPSRGVLCSVYEPADIARGYERGGAAAVSVLTEPTFFDGALEHLAAARDALTVPLLRKDFIVDEYQLFEACTHGADAVLLIVAALPDKRLLSLHRAADALGLAVLVEAHDVSEVERAVAAGARVVGINNRNLRTLQVDTAASARAAAHIPADVVAVSESGLKSTADLARMRDLGYRAFLIGERFMTAPNPGEALASLLTGAATGRPQ